MDIFTVSLWASLTLQETQFVHDSINRPKKEFNLRNEFSGWNVHGITNTSGLLQSK